jgi:transcriptional regulator with XRE-family HTH domain
MAERDDNSHHDLMGRMDQFSQETRQEGDFLAEIGTMSGDAEDTGDQGNLGQRVRRFRREKDLSIAELAESSGLTEAEISDIEGGAANPPLGVLIKLGKALGMQFGSLISGGSLRPYVITRQENQPDVSRLTGPRQTSYGYTYLSLAAEKKNRAMEPFLITLRTPQTEVAPAAHGGEEFIYVLEGRMEAVIENKTEVLGPGDSIYYDSNVPTWCARLGMSPPQFWL